jgi:hypothetical protein
MSLAGARRHVAIVDGHAPHLAPVLLKEQRARLLPP